MSSVAAWLSDQQVPLINLRDVFISMQQQLPPELHFGKYGLQCNLLFSDDHFDIDESSAYQLAGQVIHFAGRRFVQLSFQISLDQDFKTVFDDLGLSDVMSSYVLAEQTSADSENDIDIEPGFAVSDPVALAACGGITWAIQESTVGKDIVSVANEQGIYSNDVAMLLAWFNAILDNTDNYQALLERTPTYLFSILFDAREGDLRMVGLRQNERENGDNSPYEHLWYVRQPGFVGMARTKEATQKLLASEQGVQPVQVGNQTPAVFKASDL
ncbi:MAG: hypothetical protein JWL85_588 [Candidatus Saccharibacteria bacterium]|nr:hypothetical protein [Candidatus Saccharibacteria bacterium]